MQLKLDKVTKDFLPLIQQSKAVVPVDLDLSGFSEAVLPEQYILLPVLKIYIYSHIYIYIHTHKQQTFSLVITIKF